MRYQVIAIIGGEAKVIETKETMDDALDLIETMEDFDGDSGVYDEYRVRIIRD